jgi:hypothetical protein
MTVSLKAYFTTLNTNETEHKCLSRFIYFYAECRYVECRYAECRYAECRGADLYL